MCPSSLSSLVSLRTCGPSVTSTTPVGFTPGQIQHAYRFDQVAFASGANGCGETIAVVDAFDHPNIASDLHVFDQTFGLSDTDCTGSSALTKATPQGKPRTDAGWALEISLDVEWAHAIAPGAHVLLVEARTVGSRWAAPAPERLNGPR